MVIPSFPKFSSLLIAPAYASPVFSACPIKLLFTNMFMLTATSINITTIVIIRATNVIPDLFFIFKFILYSPP